MATIDDKAVKEEVPSSMRIDWQLGKTFGECMLEMYDFRLWTDVKFRCKDHEEGEFIQAHKLILAARSPVFQALFFGPCSQQNDEVDMKAARSETLCLFLRYFYSDMITLTEENALKVLEMAHCYQVTCLVKKCADYLATVISASNVCVILAFAMQYDLAYLRYFCCFFIDNHAEEVLKSDGFMNLPADCLLYILKGDTLYADETLILEASEKWATKKAIESGLEVNGTNTRECLGKSFYQLRLPTMTYKSLLEHISRKGYLSVEEYADIAACINNVPDVSVSTNSCVTRLPWFEKIIINQKGSSVISDYISNTFTITASKDVALSSFVLCDIIPYICCPHATDNAFMRNRSRTNLGTFGIHDGVDLPINLDFVLSVSILIKGDNRKMNFSLHQSQTKTVRFRSQVLLKKIDGPHTVEMLVKYKTKSNVMMKTETCAINEDTKSVTGNIHVSSISGNFAGVESITFANLSNRDAHN